VGVSKQPLYAMRGQHPRLWPAARDAKRRSGRIGILKKEEQVNRHREGQQLRLETYSPEGQDTTPSINDYSVT
jgi:hypothetical protein